MQAERNFRFELCAAVYVLLACPFFGFAPAEWALVFLCIGGVLALVQAIKSIGPTLTSIFGAMEPLTAVVIGVWVFAEPFTAKGAAGILLIVAAVSVVVLRSRKG